MATYRISEDFFDQCKFNDNGEILAVEDAVDGIPCVNG